MRFRYGFCFRSRNLFAGALFAAMGACSGKDDAASPSPLSTPGDASATSNDANASDGAFDAHDDAAADAAMPSDAAPSCKPPALFEPGDPSGHPDPLNPPTGQARAGKLSLAQLPTKRTGLELWADGDFVLANDKVAALIERARPSERYDPWGGKFVGVEPFGPGDDRPRVHVVTVAAIELCRLRQPPLVPQTVGSHLAILRP